MICSHLYSGSNILYDAMDQHPRIQGFKRREGNLYGSLLSVINLANQDHKVKNKSAIYLDELLHNFQIYSKDLYKCCKFIYVIRRPEPTLNYMIAVDKKTPEFSILYYKYRIRRICEMAKRTPGAVFLTYDDLILNRGLNLIEEYLDLYQPIQFDPKLLENISLGSGTELLGSTLRSEIENIYEKYLYFLKNQSLRRLP